MWEDKQTEKRETRLRIHLTDEDLGDKTEKGEDISSFTFVTTQRNWMKHPSLIFITRNRVCNLFWWKEIMDKKKGCHESNDKNKDRERGWRRMTWKRPQVSDQDVIHVYRRDKHTRIICFHDTMICNRYFFLKFSASVIAMNFDLWISWSRQTQRQTATRTFQKTSQSFMTFAWCCCWMIYSLTEKMSIF